MSYQLAILGNLYPTQANLQVLSDYEINVGSIPGLNIFKSADVKKGFHGMASRITWPYAIR